MSQKLRIAIYARYSTKNQRDLSLESQKSACKDFLDNQGIFGDIVYFEDAGVSGGEGPAGRPGYSALLDAIYAQEIDLVISFDQSRLSRCTLEMPRFRKIISALNVRFITATGSVDSTASSFGLVSGINAVVDEQYREGASAHVREGQSSIAKVGGILGRLPFGYVLRREVLPDGAVASHWEIDEEAASAVKLAFDLRANSGATFSSIAREFNLRGIPTPGGSTSWSAAAISRLLRNRIYIGNVIWGGGVGGKRILESRLRSQGLPVPPSLPAPAVRFNYWIPELAIIDEELFLRASPSSPVASTRRGGSAYWGSSLVKHTCGNFLSAKHVEKGTPTLRCTSCLKLLYEDPSFVVAPRDNLGMSGSLLQVLLEEVLSYLLSEDLLSEFKRRLAEVVEKGSGSLEIERLEAELSARSLALSRRFEASLNLPEALYKKEVVFIEKEGAELKLLESNIVKRKEASSFDPEAFKSQLGLTLDPRALLSSLFTLPAGELRSFFQRVFPSITYLGGGSDEFTYRVSLDVDFPSLIAELSGTTSVASEVVTYEFELATFYGALAVAPSISLVEASGALVELRGMTKDCVDCQKTLPLSSFSRTSRPNGGYYLRSFCVECTSVRNKKASAEYRARVASKKPST